MKSDLQSQIKVLTDQLVSLRQKINQPEQEIELKQLRVLAQQPDFWTEPEKAVATQQKIKSLEETQATLETFQQELKDLSNFLALVDDNDPTALEASQRLAQLQKDLELKEIELFLVGPYDRFPAVFTIQAGAGGRDAEDWAAMLLRMYQRYFERRGWRFQIIHQQFSEGGGPEGRLGVKETSLEIKGDYAYGLLKAENGVHRLVRISPFSAKQLRHTSFANVEILPRLSQVEASQLKINPEELKIDTFRSSGPGGQNVNKRESAVRVTHLPTGLVASSQIERGQAANRQIALEFLAAKIIRLREWQREQELNRLKGKSQEASFGGQRRSYVLYPYKLVKDHKTEAQTSDVSSVLEGNLDLFIQAGVRS